ncbi:hypothetical protein [Mycobacterium sp.]|uniref:hypothetical protein n=1 Tax=Mycobacterium sp. TaxID=1785 RepID=UPI002CDC3274|nr:hypothetical protein [Mycobacterium sp.]HTY34011.1 hypothetical protein [Mycobacterium sp.]
MAAAVQSTTGWAFLVARGRHRGYRSILAPDFLAESGEHRMLAEFIVDDVDSAGPPRIIPLMARRAGPVTVVYRSHRMTPADLADAASDASDGQPVTDQHGRPLDLLYGFVSRAPGISQAREDDLATAKCQALDVYRDFLSDEAGFRTATSHAYPVQIVAEPSTAQPRPVAPYPPTPVPGLPRPEESAAAPTSPGRRTAVIVAVAVLVGLLVIAVVAIWLAWHPDKRPATPIRGGGGWQVNSNSAFPEDPGEVGTIVVQMRELQFRSGGGE